jgi:hypothetical protein
MPPFDGVQAQGVRQRREHLGRRPNLAALLQPRVPSRSNPREQGDFLTPQPRRPASESVWQPHVGRR